MSVVYRAQMEGPDGFSKRVALKVVHDSLARQPEFTHQFISEGRLGGYLSHPHIVEILEYGKEHDRLYLAMEYVDGPTVAQLMKYHKTQGRRLPQEVVLEILSQACRGLAYAHNATDHSDRPLRLIHRDLKPSNVLVNMHGVVKIADFGVARAETNVVKTLNSGLIKGTGPYMSPEQAWGAADLDHRSDIFSLGVMLFELTTLELLYDGRTLEVSIRQAQDAKIEPRLELLPDTPWRPRLRDILTRALARDRADRYPSAGEMADVLDELRVSLPPKVSLRKWMGAMGASWRELPGIDAMFAQILMPPGASTLSGEDAGDLPSVAHPRTHHDPPSAPLDVEGDLEPTEQADAPTLQTSSSSLRRFGAWISAAALATVLAIGVLSWLGRPPEAPPPLEPPVKTAPDRASGGIRTEPVQPAPGGIRTEPAGIEPAGIESRPGPQDGAAIDAPRATGVEAGSGKLEQTATDPHVADVDATVSRGSTGVAPAARRPSLSLNSRPHSQIMLDGKKLNGFPIRNLRVDEGEHTIVFTSEVGIQLLEHIMTRGGTHQTCTALFSEGRVECRVKAAN